MNNQTVNILIINGVNLNNIGSREINIYGSTNFDDYLQSLATIYPDVKIDYFQSEEQGVLASKISQARKYDGIVLNAGAYTHSSVVIADAVRAATCDVIEVHISNLFGREQYRKNSLISTHCQGFISGFGLTSYRLAIESIRIKKIMNS